MGGGPLFVARSAKSGEGGNGEVKAHRTSGDRSGRTNPLWCKTEQGKRAAGPALRLRPKNNPG